MTESIKTIPFFTIALIATIAWFIRPDIIEIHSWHTLILFLSTVISIMFNILPLGASGLLSISLFALTASAGAVSPHKAISDALSGFSNDLLWLIVVAFFIAKGFIKTGLGERIALLLVMHFGKRTIGLAYALAFADLLLSPMTPSSTTRAGGVVYPIAASLARRFNSYGEDESRHKIGKYLIACVSHINDITGALFITAYAANPLIVKLATSFGVELRWGTWFMAAIVPSMIAFFFVPVLLYFLLAPSIEETPEAPLFARYELSKMPRLSFYEIMMGIIFVVTVSLWLLSDILHIHTTAVALFTLSLLVISGVLTWDDIQSEKTAWDTFIWLSALFMMTDFLSKLGFTRWFGLLLSEHLHAMTSMHWIIILVTLNAIYTYLHYFFASGTAQVAALYVVFLGVGIALGVPAYPLALLLGFSSSLYGSLTPYTHARGLILFESGYVQKHEWIKTGFIINLINQFIFSVIGLAWWKMIGLY